MPTERQIFSTDEFEAALDAGTLRGKTVIVDGSVPEIGNGTGCSPPPPDFRCSLGVLAGTDPRVRVWYERWPEKENEGAHFEGGDITWPWWGGPNWPVEGTLLLRVTDEGEVQFIGRAHDPEQELVRSVADTAALDVNSIDPEVVVLVDGWLTGIGGILSCPQPPPGVIAGLPTRWCSNSGYLSDGASRNAWSEAEGAAVIQLQSNAYWDYAADPHPQLAQAGDGEPRFGTYALSPRLEGWCSNGTAPCWQWNLVARLNVGGYMESGPILHAAPP